MKKEVMKNNENNLFFNLKDVTKKTFDDRWVKFAFGPQGKIKTKNLNLGVVNFDPGKEVLNHRHDTDEALFVLSGNGKVKVGTDIHDIKRNDFVFIPGQTDHSVMTEKNKIKILFIFGGPILIDK